jgi:HPt (histidine-containing phosphotransfer) domain-containing protein
MVVRSVLGRTACRGRQLHHDHHGGTGGGTGGRLIATIAANERYRGPAACCRLKGPPRRTDAFAMVTPLTTAPPAAAPAATPSADTVDLAPLRELRLLSADLVPELLDLYLAVAPEQLSDLGAALTAADFERVRFCAHLLRDSCVNVGATGLHALAEELERLGRNGSVVGGRALFNQLAAALPVVCTTLSRDRNQPGGLI